MPVKKLRLVVLLSGSGTTLENLYERAADGTLNAEVVAVVSTRRNAYGLVRAEKRGTPAHVITKSECPDPGEYGRRVGRIAEAAGADLIVFAGFMIRMNVPAGWEGKIVNVHPALIPAFSGRGYYGHHVHEAALARGCKVTGCTVHFVDDEYDAGPIILQRCVEIMDDDDPATLAERVQAAERAAYPEALNLIAAGRVEICGRRTIIGPAR